MGNMDGKIALVSAASKGLGRASALAIARRGAKLAVCSRSANEIASTADEIAKECGVETWHCAADVTNPDDVQRFVNNAASHFGGVDVLVSNAGGPPPGGFADFDDSDWKNAFDLSVMGAIRLARAVIPYMKTRGGGRLIFILSSSVREPIDNLILSNVMRPAVAGFSKSLSRELAKDNILVNVVAPGTFLTDRVTHHRKMVAKKNNITFEQALDQAAQSIPLGRLGDPAEFAAMVAFLASPEASYISGGVFCVDGGRLRGI